MCCYMVNDGIDQCCIGYLRHYCTKFNNYNSTFIQVVDFIAPNDADITRSKISLLSWMGKGGPYWSDQTP